MDTNTVTPEQARRVLEAVKKRYSAYIAAGCGTPTLHTEYDYLGTGPLHRHRLGGRPR